MKKFIIIFFLLTAFFAKGQSSENPILLSTEVKKISEMEFDIVFKAQLFKGWYLYSQYNPENASLPLEITMQEGETGYILVGKAKEESPFKKYSDVWEKEEIVFKEKAIIMQRIQLTNKEISQIKLNFFGQVCETACINIDENFTISLQGKIVSETISIDERSKELSQKLKLDLKNKELLTETSTTNSEKSTGLMGIFILGFVGGLLALLTPCVFPMIPLTVSFFTKQ